jgi:primosomal protein N' (replication factor Y)
MKRYVEAHPVPPVPDLPPLTYRIPDSLVDRCLLGSRIVVPLGRRKVTAIATALCDQAPAGVHCKDVVSILDEQPILTDNLLTLIDWMAGYYVASQAEVLSLVVPRGLTSTSRRILTLTEADEPRGEVERAVVEQLRAVGGTSPTQDVRRALAPRSVDAAIRKLVARGVLTAEDRIDEPQVRPNTQRFVELLETLEDERIADLFRRAHKRRQIYEYLLGSPRRRASVAELAELFPHPQAQVLELERAGVVRRIDLEVYRGIPIEPEGGQAPTLSDAQQAALHHVCSALGSFAPILLHGITSSGKTEIYLRAIERALAKSGSALVLVPEISLTHQTVARLVGRFGPTVAVLHSELSAKERWEEWRRIRRGDARIAVGARSAVLAPLEDIRLIVVDEEHDAAYKQDDGVRYQGRDVAIMRGKLTGCPVLLGSATPSIESWHHAENGRYLRLSLPDRVTSSPLPVVEVVDLRGRDITATGGLSTRLRELLESNFAEGGQSLIFLNRRGFAGHLQCYECGEIEQCTHCSVGMTFHRTEERIRCHHCDETRAVPERCSHCGKDALSMHGLGTQRLEETLRQLLGDARVERLDRDTGRKRGHVRDVLAEWRAGLVDVLIGTQMITKGHDAAGVTLVGVVHADLGLGVPDFRSTERTFQMLTQVAGRAGRGDRRGHVVIQTYRPDHFAISSAARHDYDAFAREELASRHELSYPPFSRMALLRIEGPDLERTEALAAAVGRSLRALASRASHLVVRGPAPAAIERIKGRYRMQIQLRSTDGAIVRHAAQQIRAAFREKAKRDGLRLLVDVDPVEML